jgi:hypothetical protein
MDNKTEIVELNAQCDALIKARSFVFGKRVKARCTFISQASQHARHNN